MNKFEILKVLLIWSVTAVICCMVVLLWEMHRKVK